MVLVRRMRGMLLLDTGTRWDARPRGLLLTVLLLLPAVFLPQALRLLVQLGLLLAGRLLLRLEYLLRQLLVFLFAFLALPRLHLLLLPETCILGFDFPLRPRVQGRLLWWPCFTLWDCDPRPLWTTVWTAVAVRCSLSSWLLRWCCLPATRCRHDAGRVGHVESLVQLTEEDIADDHSTQHQHHLEPLEVLHLHPVEVGLVQRDLLEALEDGDGDVRLLVLSFGAIDIGGLAAQEADEVLGQLAVSAPAELQLGGCLARRGVTLGAVEGRAGRLTEGPLGHLKVPRGRRVPRLVLVPDDDLLVGIVELDGELGWEDGLWGRGNPSILADCFLGQGGLRPFRDD